MPSSQMKCSNMAQDGFVHVVLRPLPPTEDDMPNQVRVELAVLDSGKVSWVYRCFLYIFDNRCDRASANRLLQDNGCL